MLLVSSVIFTGAVVVPNVIGVIIVDGLMKVTVVTWPIPILLPDFYVVPFSLTFYVFPPFVFERLVELTRLVERVGVLERVEELAPRTVLTERFFGEAFFFNSATIAFNLSLSGVGVGVGAASTAGEGSTSSTILL
jgi:hypothetical protein